MLDVEFTELWRTLCVTVGTSYTMSRVVGFVGTSGKTSTPIK